MSGADEDPSNALLACLLLPQFNAGSAGAANFIAGQAFLNTNAAAASAMLTFMLLVSGWQGGAEGTHKCTTYKIRSTLVDNAIVVRQKCLCNILPRSPHINTVLGCVTIESSSLCWCPECVSNCLTSADRTIPQVREPMNCAGAGCLWRCPKCRTH
jgi:hypothetical protein